MVESGCLETKTLKFCNDSEYRADMSKSKTSKQKTEKSSKAFGQLQKQSFDYKPEAILALVLKRHRTNKYDTRSTTLFRKYYETKTSESKMVRKKISLFC